MSNSKLKPIWYGKKTFEIIEGFNYQGVSLYAKGLFSCDKETYEDNKQFLGEEYIQKSKEELKKEKESKELKEKQEKEETDKKENEKQSQENASENTKVKIEGYKIKNEEELEKLSDAGMKEKDINRDDKDGMYIKPNSKFFPKKRGIFNKIFNK